MGGLRAGMVASVPASQPQGALSWPRSIHR